jgi:uncharacterized repeat protein (TIGR01451 family)
MIEYNPNPHNTSFNIYIPSVDITVTNGLWYYLTAEQKYQDSYAVGNTPVFMFGVRNSATYDEATGLILQYIIPEGFEYVGCNPAPGMGTATYTYDSINKQGILTWTLNYMPKGGSANIYVTLRVTAVGNKTPQLTTTAKLLHVDQYDVNSANDQNKTCGIIGQPCAEIQVNQTEQTYTQNNQQYVTYTITITNNGPSNATGLQITDLLPNGLTYVNHTISNNSGTTWNTNDTSYKPTTGLWNIGNFTYGTGTRILNITALITATSGTIINTATRTAVTEKDSNYDNNAQSTYLTIQ